VSALVSVVIPAFDAQATIEAAVESVLAQTHREVEVVVVDDGSTDATAARVARFEPGVQCVRTPNRGVSSARNRGIEATSGPYVAFLDADDVWEPAKLERQVAELEADPEAGACFTGAWMVDADGRELEYMPARHYDDYCAALLLHSMVVTQGSSSLLVRRDVVDRCGGFDSRFSQSADWDFALRLSLATRLVGVDEPLVRYRSVAGSMSSDIELLEHDTFAVLDSFFADGGGRYAPLRRRAYSNHWMIVSGSYLHAGRPGPAVRCLVNGVRLHPPNLRRAWPRNWLGARRRAGRASVSA
jgi:glycosyltransferase involved in cell wall biosynthesis